MGFNVPGQLLIWLAFAANLLVGFAYFKVARGDLSYQSLARRSYRLFVLASTLAAIYLFYLFFSYNYTIRYVFEYSDRSLPFFYLLSAFWAGQEGSYLLWLVFSCFFGYLIIGRAGRYTNYAMVIYSVVNLFFLSMLIKLSPFALLDFYTEDGAGLNPLLQDPWMVVHPPVVFIGYAMSAVPFAIAIAALILNDYSDWVRRVFPWVGVTALMIGAGNILGGYWAYKTLGWGGYWAWDPVENSSFIPWFVSLGLLHGLALERRTGALRKTNVLVTALVFILVVYGTFLTRSGVLADFSVHSFVDLGVNAYMIGFLILFVVMTIGLFVPRFKSLGHVPLSYNIYGRDFFLFAGLSLLFVFGMIVLFWTSLPLITSLFSSNPRAADIATYNSFALPFAILFAFLLTVSPFAGAIAFVPKGWKIKLVVTVIMSITIGAGLHRVIPQSSLIFSLLSIIILAGLALYLLKPNLVARLVPSIVALIAAIVLLPVLGIRNPLYILFIGTTLMAVVSNVVVLVRLLPRGWRLAGAQLSHFGFGLMTIGILGSTAYASNEKLVLPQGKSGGVYGVNIVYQGMENNIQYPKNKLILTVDDGNRTEDARPELYYSKRLDGLMKKPYIKKSLLYDLYFSPQQIQEGHRQGGLKLAKGDTKLIGDYALTFNGFSMDQHEQSQSDLRVAAQLLVEWGETLDTINPTVVVTTAADGSSSSITIPDKFGENNKYEVFIERILADEKAVVVTIPGLVDAKETATLILDVTKKPVINLVWVGTTLILLGSLITFLRRRGELRR